MTFEIILFIIALVGIVVVLGIRVFELKSDKVILSRESTDSKLRSLVFFCGNFLYRVVLSFKKFILNIPVFVQKIPGKLSAFTYRRFQKHVDLVKGRGVLQTKGSVPVFFSQIDEHKKEIRGQK